MVDSFSSAVNVRKKSHMCNVSLWMRDYSAKEYSRANNVAEDDRDYGL